MSQVPQLEYICIKQFPLTNTFVQTKLKFANNLKTWGEKKINQAYLLLQVIHPALKQRGSLGSTFWAPAVGGSEGCVTFTSHPAGNWESVDLAATEVDPWEIHLVVSSVQGFSPSWRGHSQVPVPRGVGQVAC